MNRRSFLRQAGGLAVWSLLGCGGADAADDLTGSVVRPTDPGYAQARRLFNPALDSPSPTAIVYCDTTKDIQRAVSWARARQVTCTARSGGHSNEGYSVGDGLVVDVSRMDAVSLDGATARVETGCRLLDLYDRLGTRGVTIPAGTSATVGIGGLTLGGGCGMLSRKLGLTCDNLLEVEIVTANGDVLVCNATDHTDLFWACRGGGGGNFGIATSFKFRVHPIDRVAFYEIEWPWRDAGLVLDTWQRWAPHAPDELTSVLMAYSGGGRNPVVESHGAYLGPAEHLPSLLKALLQVGTPRRQATGSETYRAATRRWAGPDPYAAAEPQMTQGDFVEAILPAAALDRILHRLDRRRTMPGYGGVELNALGGAISTLPSDATAFAHRNARFLCLYEANWKSPEEATGNRTWVRDLQKDLRPYVAGSYVNFVDGDRVDWPTAYYGENLERLQSVKRRYDPDDFFRFAQSIPGSRK